MSQVRSEQAFVKAVRPTEEKLKADVNTVLVRLNHLTCPPQSVAPFVAGVVGRFFVEECWGDTENGRKLDWVRVMRLMDDKGTTKAYAIDRTWKRVLGKLNALELGVVLGMAVQAGKTKGEGK